jgi:hypothetical protein
MQAFARVVDAGSFTKAAELTDQSLMARRGDPALCRR